MIASIICGVSPQMFLTPELQGVKLDPMYDNLNLVEYHSQIHVA